MFGFWTYHMYQWNMSTTDTPTLHIFPRMDFGYPVSFGELLSYWWVFTMLTINEDAWFVSCENAYIDSIDIVHSVFYMHDLCFTHVERIFHMPSNMPRSMSIYVTYVVFMRHICCLYVSHMVSLYVYLIRAHVSILWASYRVKLLN